MQVSYTDNRGTFESLTSAATAVVASAVIMGTNAANTLNGTALDDHILGLGGNDVLNGLAGNDILDGGAGNDTWMAASAPMSCSVVWATTSISSITSAIR